MAAHRYWRVNVTQTPRNVAGCKRLRFAETQGGPDVTQGAGGTPFATSQYGGFGPANCFDPFSSDFWSSDGSLPQAIGYDFGAGNEKDIVEFGWMGRPDGLVGSDSFGDASLEWSDDGAAYTSVLDVVDQPNDWTVGGTKYFSYLPPLDIVAVPQAHLFAIYTLAAESVFVLQGGDIVVYNVPAEGITATAAGLTIPYNRTARSLDVQQAGMLAVTRGRIANPRLRAWTFTLDTHDFYVLRLGDDATLVYDTASEQWVDWASGDIPFWRLNTGMNWTGAQALAHTFGSAVVAGDDVHGVLWFLDPDLAWDQHPFPENPTQELPFTRIVTGQVLATGRLALPCYAIFLDGDNYGSDATQYVASVRLDYSDDQGRNFQSAESLLTQPDITVNNPYSWTSLGQITSPGRIFRVIDTGVLTRIDSMSMNDDG